MGATEDAARRRFAAARAEAGSTERTAGPAEAFCRPIGRPDAFPAGETFGQVSFVAQAE